MPFLLSTDEGDHEVDLRYDGTPLPDSPFPVAAIRGCNPQKVKAYGDGLEKGIVDEENTFTIETRNAGKKVHLELKIAVSYVVENAN